MQEEGLPSPAPVRWRTIWASIGSVVLVLAAYQLIEQIGRVLAWMVVALFLAVVLNPAVDLLEHRAKVRRGLSTALVVLVGIGVVGGMLWAFIAPLVDQAQQFADDLPGLVEDAREGRGTIGELVDRYDLEQWVEDNQDRLRDFVGQLGTPALGVVRSIFNGLIAGLTILVLTVLLLLQGPKLTSGIQLLLPERHRARVTTIGRDSSRAVSGYVGGNVLISLIAGVASWIALALIGVPYAGVLALFVAFCDLIPLIGATLGAIPPILVAFLQGVPQGVAVLVFFVVYQQFENHVLQVTVMSRTVDINPLGVMVSVLVAVELFGFLGALLAIPAAGVLQVLIRDLYDTRTGRLRTVEPDPG